MDLIKEFILFIFFTILIVLISKYILVVLLRKLAETLDFKPKTVGNITGMATSVPELLTVSFSAATGFISTSMINILSSNVINTILYFYSITFNKNTHLLKNRAIIIDLVMVGFTIFIPCFMIFFNMPLDLSVIPLFFLLFIFFYFINSYCHRRFLKKEEAVIEKEIAAETKWLKGKKRKSTMYIVGLIVSGILLFIIGNELSNVLENLATTFGVPEIILGILLGFTTSLPELITFFESQRFYKKKNENIQGVIETTNNLLSSNILNLFIIQSIGIFLYIVLT